MMAGIAETYRCMGRLDESLAMYQEVAAARRGAADPGADR